MNASANCNASRPRDVDRRFLRFQKKLAGTADAEATATYAEANDRDADFYAFTRSLESYEKTMDSTTTFILATDSEFLTYLEKSR